MGWYKFKPALCTRFQCPALRRLQSCVQRPHFADLAEGAKEHAIGFSTLADLRRIEAALEVLEATGADLSAPRPIVTVVGAGYAGVELAATVAERMAGKALVHLLSPTGDIMPVRLHQKTLVYASITKLAFTRNYVARC
jgi:hypothetical protein